MAVVTTVSRKTAYRRISFLIVAVSAPERHRIGFQSHFARAAHATYSVGSVRSSGRTHIYIDRYIQARAWQYKFHHLTYLREARSARQLYISHKISIEHPSVGLASLAQLYGMLHRDFPPPVDRVTCSNLLCTRQVSTAVPGYYAQTYKY